MRNNLIVALIAAVFLMFTLPASSSAGNRMGHDPCAEALDKKG